MVDLSRSEHRDPAYLTGAEAAELLGVKRETLYAYASRGMLRGIPGGQGRARLYLRADIERLKARHDARAGHGPVAADALRWGEPVIESALTAIGPRGPVYRGHEAVALALRDVPSEAVAELLWTGELPAEGAGPPQRPVRLPVRPAKLAALLPAGTPPITTLAIAVPALGAHDATRHVGAPSADGRIPTSDAERARARALVRSMAALVGLGRDARHATAALAAEGTARRLLLSLGVNPSKKAERAVERALLVSADHELDASTFAVRVAASTGADLYACISAGLATLSGPRHGGVTDRVEALVAEAGRPDRAAAAVHERLRRGEPIAGFGHRLYPDGDPRAQALLDTARSLAPQNTALRTVLALVEALRDAGLEPPSLDVGLVAIASALGLPPGSAAALFAVGRAAGWIAHAFEQREAGYQLRPRARYTGP